MQHETGSEPGGGEFGGRDRQPDDGAESWTQFPAGRYGQAGDLGGTGGGYGAPGGPGEPGRPADSPGGFDAPGGYGGWAGPPGYGEPPRRRRRGRVVVYALVAVLAAALGAGAAVGLDNGQRTPSTGVSSNQVPGPHSNAGSAGSGPLNQQTVASKVEPGVVDIDAAIQYSGGTSSEGTGMIINADGLILTNNHVINGARTIRVTLAATGTSYTATVLGYDASQDVALLQIKSATALKPIAVGDSSQVVLGMPVLAFGNAQGRGGRPAAASGIINSLNKTISPTDESTGATETLHNMLQTNADIVSGDSGGPLANAAGQVIGMDTANASSSQGSANVLGYAIPINTALAVARQIATGQASATVQVGVPGFLGVLVPQSTSADPRQQAQQQQQQQGGAGSPRSPGPPGSPGGQAPGSQGCINNNADTSVPTAIAPASSGALVDGVLCGTPAATAGLASGDVVTSVNGQAVTTPNSLTTMMSQLRPGAKVTLHWENPSGQQKTSTLTLGAAPAR
jgi:S1-C subfamily serine protease